MKVSVVLPTYRRPDDLHRCLVGLQQQERLPDEVVLIVNQEDGPTQAFLTQWTHWPALKVVHTAQKGQVAQLNLGLQHSTGEVLAITDDDAVPQVSWLARIEQHFAANADLGGVGGRDIVHEHGTILSGDAQVIGSVLWFGRVVGNHHIGGRACASVDILKGANMSYRAKAVEGLQFDTDLRGQGAQICNDMAFSLGVRKRGWRLLYDPAVCVDHFPAQRFDADDRALPTPQALEDRAFNFYLALRRYMQPGLRKRAALLWAWLIGVKNSPGALRGLLARLRGDQRGKDLRRSTRQAWQAARLVANAPPEAGKVS